LHLSPFTLDEFEKAILHSGDEHCSLIAEVHSCLVYNIRQVTSQKNVAISSLYEHSQENTSVAEEDNDLVPIDELIEAMRERGSNWERSPLRSTSAREGWEEAVIGLLKDVCPYFSVRQMYLQTCSYIACYRRSVPEVEACAYRIDIPGRRRCHGCA
jgi:hypothetical protein